VTEYANESKTKQWNECISNRLEELRGWFTADSWTKGVRPYLNAILSDRREHMEKQDNEPKSDQFIKGQIAMLKQIMAIPMVIDNQIAQIEANKKVKPSGDAGY
jgi:hypothetical protein